MGSMRIWLAAVICTLNVCLDFGSSIPNILFVLVDDLGWNDVSYHGGSDFETPNIDKLAEDALELTNYYVQHYCTPTRSALMSGRYPMRDGLQQYVIRSMSAYGMPLDVTTMPEHLKTAGYSTHLIGKWHLGFFDPAYTPIHRGFDSFVGYYGDKEDYFTKNNSEWGLCAKTGVFCEVSGLDFRQNVDPWLSDQYSTYLYGNETLRIMQEHVDEGNQNPFFILFSSQAAHIPYDAPQEYKDQYSTLQHSERREMAAVLSVLDETLGKITDYLQSEESGYLWENTIVVVSTDNGGHNSEGHSNYPLRGGKMTLWEGGIKATAFITGGWLPDERRGMKMDALMHVTDWLPTLMSFAGAQPDDKVPIDGYDQSGNIRMGVREVYLPREEILHNVLPEGFGKSRTSCYSEFCGAIRWRDYKLVIGMDHIMNASSEFPCDNAWCDTAVKEDASHSIQCSENGNNDDFPSISADDCLFNGAACLFNVVEDPCEWNDISGDTTAILELLTDKLLQYNLSQMYPLYRGHKESPLDANPSKFGGFWSPWKNVEDLTFSKVTPRSPLSNWKWIVVIVGLSILICVHLSFGCWCVYQRRKRTHGYHAEYKRIDDVSVSITHPMKYLQ